MYDIEKRVIALEKQLNQIVRVGQVSSIDAGKGTARVQLPDSGKVISHNLPVLFSKTQDDKFYTMPDVGEQVLCVFLPNGLEQGFILGAIYSQMDSPPVNDPDKTHIKFKDGTVLEYDRAAHKLSGQVVGDIDLTATKSAKIKAGTVMNLEAPQINIAGNVSTMAVGGGGTTETKTADTQQTGNFTLTGDLHVDGNITCTGSNPNNHDH